MNFFAIRACRYVFLSTLLCAAAHSASVCSSVCNVGFVTFDVTFPPNVGGFDIQNQTGPNSTPAPTPDFPITNSVSLTNLSLTVTLQSGPPQTFGPGSGYFTLSADGLSFDGATSFNETTNPVVSATLTGVFATTSLTLNDGTTLTISPDFTVKITDPSGLLADGDFALITATPGSGPPSGAPEPASWFLLAGGLAVLAIVSVRRKLRALRGTLSIAGLFVAASVAIVAPARAAVTLSTWTVPSSGVSGTNDVWVTASGFPSGSLTPSNITVTFETSCGVTTGSKADTALQVVNIVGSTNRIKFLVPAGLNTAKYFVSLSGKTSTGTTFTSSNCAAINVTHGSTTLASCNPGSSMGLVVPNKAPSGVTKVTAYVPNGWWGGGATGIRVVPIEGSGSPASISTPALTNSCSSNSVTGETVCTANNTDIYLVAGSTLSKTLTSAANASPVFSGGSCQNCGVAVNAVANQAVIQIGFTAPGFSGNSALQFLDLRTRTLAAPVPAQNLVSENVLWDPLNSWILSPNEQSVYDIFKITGAGTPTSSNTHEFGRPVSDGGEFDSAGEDCTTGIALASVEFTGNLFIADLKQATFTSGSPAGSWSGASQIQHFPEFEGLAAGTTGLAIAPGSTHLGVVAGEFGGNLIGVIKLPATSGSGTPAVVDYVVATLPPDPAGRTFANGFDPHTTTAYTSPNNGKAYGVAADWASGVPDYVAVIDLQGLLNATRTGSHTVSSSVDLLATGLVRYVKTF